MKSILPLIIAFVLVAMLSVATLYYITSVVTYNADISMNRTHRAEWRVLEEEVRSILLTILRKNSHYALQKFEETFLNNYEDDGFYEEPSKVIIRKVVIRRGRRRYLLLNMYIYYRYSKYSSTIYYCYLNGNIDDLYELNLQGYNMSRNDYLDAINKASTDATSLLSEYSYTTIMRWINMREKLGYKIYLINMTAYFNVSLESNPVNGSVGISREGINVVLDVYSPWSGYKRINETFKEAVEGDTQIYLPIKALAYIVIGGEKVSYILDPQNISVVLYSKMFHRMSELEYIYGTLDKIILNEVGGYYLGKGETILYFGIQARRNIIAYILNSIIYNMSLSDPDYDDTFQVPCSEDDPNTYIPRHTMTFFIGGLIYANIDGIYVVTPLQIVYSYLFDTQPQNYDWSYSDYIVGDIGQVNWT